MDKWKYFSYQKYYKLSWYVEILKKFFSRQWIWRLKSLLCNDSRKLDVYNLFPPIYRTSNVSLMGRKFKKLLYSKFNKLMKKNSHDVSRIVVKKTGFNFQIEFRIDCRFSQYFYNVTIYSIFEKKSANWIIVF